MTKKRCCVFAHFDMDGIVDPYVFCYLHALRPYVQKLVFISTSQISSEQISQLELLGAQVTCRENCGYDFYSWKVGIEKVNLHEFDELLLANDSCYAPLYDFEELFLKMDNLKCDFWGITKSYRYAKHIQSYFVCYRKSVIESGVFQEFWGALVPIENKIKLVRRYEVGLSQALFRNGFTMRHYFGLTPIKYLLMLPGNLLLKCKVAPNLNPYKFIRNLFVSNPTFYYYREMLAQRVPLIKTGLIKDNKFQLPPINLLSIEGINTNTVECLRNHQNRINMCSHIDSWAPVTDLAGRGDKST